MLKRIMQAMFGPDLLDGMPGNLFQIAWSEYRHRFPADTAEQTYNRIKEMWDGTINTKPMPVTYKIIHHDDGRPCEREIQVPEGYERCGGHSRQTLVAVQEMSHWSPTRDGEDYLSCAVFIRPKKPAIPEGYEAIADDEFQSADAVLTQRGHASPVCIGHDKILGATYLRKRRPAITLVDGGYYETDRGGIQVSKFDRDYFGNKIFSIEGHLYTESGEPWTNPSVRPRILRRVNVSEFSA